MITNTVLFRLRRPLEGADRKQFVHALREFAAEAPLAVGPALVEESLALPGTDSPTTADALIRVEFASADDFYGYLDHDRHVTLVEKVLQPACESWTFMQAER